MQKTYTINGMTCEHCVKAITEEVSAIDGVSEVQVSLASGSMDVTSDAEIDLAKIEAAVDEAGDYTVSPATSLDTAGHPGGECGCGCGGHDKADSAEDAGCGCGGHDKADSAEHAGCGCGEHEGHQHSADAAEKHAHHGEQESCGCGHGSHGEAGAHEHHHSPAAAQTHASHGEEESCGCGGHHQHETAEAHSHVFAADGTGEPAADESGAGKHSGLLGKLLHR